MPFGDAGLGQARLHRAPRRRGRPRPAARIGDRRTCVPTGPVAEIVSRTSRHSPLRRSLDQGGMTVLEPGCSEPVRCWEPCRTVSDAVDAAPAGVAAADADAARRRPTPIRRRRHSGTHALPVAAPDRSMHVRVTRPTPVVDELIGRKPGRRGSAGPTATCADRRGARRLLRPGGCSGRRLNAPRRSARAVRSVRAVRGAPSCPSWCDRRLFSQPSEPARARAPASDRCGLFAQGITSTEIVRRAQIPASVLHVAVELGQRAGSCMSKNARHAACSSVV